MGVESKCIMPLPFHDDDQREHIIRTEFANLESSEWWKSLQIDALVLYSWGAPKYRKIARAIHRAGIRLHIHMDTSGNFEGPALKSLPLVKRILRRLKIKTQDVFRAQHLRYADIITAGETTLHAISKRVFYGEWVTEKGFPMASPVSPTCRYDGRPKKPVILFIGRWRDTVQKRAWFMMQTLEHLYRSGVTAETKIFGSLTDELRQWHDSLPKSMAESIHLIGFIPNEKLVGEYSDAQITVCPSLFEGSHIVSSESLCCGASIVVTAIPEELRTVHWYTTKNSGRISEEDTPESLAAAIRDELEAWNSGARDPHAIAAAWQPYFHVDKVFNTIFK